LPVCITSTNDAWNILLSRFGSIHDITSEGVLSTYALFSLSTVFFLLLWIFGSLHLKISATEQDVNIKFCILQHRSPSETLQMLEKAYGKAAMKKTQFYGWRKSGHVSVRAVDDAQDPVHYFRRAYSKQGNIH
jgi:hypothetical protein